MIEFLNLKSQYATIKNEIDVAIQRVLNTTEFVLGPAVKELESRVAAYSECEYGIGVASGTDALRLALNAVGIGPGDEVITTPFTFIATANTISHCGAKPVFVDIDPLTYNLSPATVSAAITSRTKAILPVHLYGHPADMDPIMDLAERHNLFVIEDCAQAIGAKYKAKSVGSFGHLGCFSFYPTKNLGGYGDGGMVVTKDKGLADKIDVLRQHGSSKKYHAEILGFNSRLDSLQAAILNVKLNYLDKWNSERRRIASLYNKLFEGTSILTPIEADYGYHVYHQYTVRTKQRDNLAAMLKEKKIGTMVYYPIAIHLQQLYAELGYHPGSMPHSEKACQEVISLPIYPELQDEQVGQIVQQVKAFSSSHDVAAP